VRGKPASERISRAALEKKKLTWEEWAEDLQLFLTELEEIARPELIIIGGGISEESHRFIGDIKVRAQLMPARLRNNAGIIGAATRAWDLRDIPRREREAAPA
jgi:polyphosphate glucokinase